MVTYGVHDVAQLLRHTPDWLYANRARLEAMGFPVPVPIPGNRLLWSKAKVDAWINGAAQSPTTGDAAAEVERWREEIGRRTRSLGLREGVANDR